MKDIKTLTTERIAELETVVEQLSGVRDQLQDAEDELNTCRIILRSFDTDITDANVPTVSSLVDDSVEPAEPATGVDPELQALIADYKAKYR